MPVLAALVVSGGATAVITSVVTDDPAPDCLAAYEKVLDLRERGLENAALEQIDEPDVEGPCGQYHDMAVNWLPSAP